MMRRLLIGVVLLAALGAVARPGLRAQEKSAGAEPEEKPLYVSPGPAKSVEVGNFYLRKRDYRAALSRFKEAADADPTYAAAYLGLGRVYEKIGLRQKALDAYRKYLDALPSEKDAEDAKTVHRAMARLERQAKPSPSSKTAARSRSN